MMAYEAALTAIIYVHKSRRDLHRNSTLHTPHSKLQTLNFHSPLLSTIRQFVAPVRTGSTRCT